MSQDDITIKCEVNNMNYLMQNQAFPFYHKQYHINNNNNNNLQTKLAHFINSLVDESHRARYREEWEEFKIVTSLPELYVLRAVLFLTELLKFVATSNIA